LFLVDNFGTAAFAAGLIRPGRTFNPFADEYGFLLGAYVAAAASSLAVDGGAPWILPSGQALSPSQVIFTPDGGSSGTTILLAAGGQRIAVSVNWLTGRVLSRELGEP
jgi:hypothetical protein